MIVALLNQKGGVGKTTLATHIAGELAMRGQHVVLLDADPQGSSLDWTQRRSQQGLPRLFSAVGLARETLHQEAPELARQVDHVVIDGPPRIAALARSALLAAERVLIPVQPSPYDLWASAEMVALIREAQVFRPQLRAAFVINRRVSTTVIGREARQALADQPLPALRSEVHQRIVFADSVAAGRLARETAPDSAAARESARRGVDSPGRRRCAGQGRPLHCSPDPRHHACATRSHQDRRLWSKRDRRRSAARIARAGVSRTPQGEHSMTASASPAAGAATAAPQPSPATLAGQSANAPLTRVALAYIEARFKLYLRFGEPARMRQLDRWRRSAVFLPNAVLCRVRWQANDYGTIRWQLMVMQACTPLDAAQRIPGVQPGARLLLHAEGENQVRAVLECTDAIEALGIAPGGASPAYWRTLANRLVASLPLPEYTVERHAAWLAGRVLS